MLEDEPRTVSDVAGQGVRVDLRLETHDCVIDREEHLIALSKRDAANTGHVLE